MATKTEYFRSGLARYQALQVVGEGGSGRVYKVVSDSGDECALKVLEPRRATVDRRNRFRNEIAFCMTKPHANIVSVIDYGPHKIGNRETLFYVMPLFDTTMRKLLKSNISSVALLDVLIGVMKGVEAAHARNVWHRDLKPENILANSTLAQVVVADWGIAHFSSEELFTLVDTGPQERLANFLYAGT